MYVISRALWPLLGLFACLGTIVNAANMLEIDLIFPRNDTYAPTDRSNNASWIPVVFAIQNAEMARHLKLSFESLIWNNSNMNAFGHADHDLTDANYTSEPYFVYHHLKIDTEGTYSLSSWVSWYICNKTGDQVGFVRSSTNFGVDFTIKKGAQEVDLVAATADEKTCSTENGIALNVTNETYEVPPSKKPYYRTHLLDGTCAVLTSTSPTTTANPCEVKIDTAVVASMSASLHAWICKGLYPPADCPKDNAVQQLAVVGIASFVATFGAIGFLLA
ncbi:hypothetical protein C7999DRAFT_30300 [Corynascus novoguineensis]|uniref:DUF7136 domain-containing protein n=1 Tax=Corynascus novoguineensis TaxID=1126955 RepID=A0AAN7CXT7_9PEZI|nr:hypothetical protein C7999DRAFT_30300 [Corynascus novoguineensis]